MLVNMSKKKQKMINLRSISIDLHDIASLTRALSHIYNIELLLLAGY